MNVIEWNGEAWIGFTNFFGSGNSGIYSVDGVKWRFSAGYQFNVSGNAASWNGEYWLAVGEDTTGVTMMRSDDGSNWTPVPTSPFTSNIPGANPAGLGIGWNGDKWVATGTDSGSNTLYWSYDAIAWYIGIVPGSNLFNHNFNPSNIHHGSDVVWNGKMWVAVGCNYGSNQHIMYSYDGRHWAYPYVYALSATNVTCLAWNGYLWAAGCIGGGTPVMLSSDGLNWAPSYGCPMGDTYGIAWTGIRWIGVGVDNGTSSVWTSGDDGMSWVPSQNVFPGGAGVCASSQRTLPYTGTTVIPKKQRVQQTDILASVNNPSTGGSNFFNSIDGGASFDQISNLNAYTTFLSVAWNGSIWVAGGVDGYTYYSAGGVNWTRQAGSALLTICTCVLWTGIAWFVGGTGSANTLITSIDGINWTIINSLPFASGSPLSITSLATSGNLIIATASDGNAYWSIDGTSWTVQSGSNLYSPNPTNYLTTTLSNIGYVSFGSTAYNGNVWVTVGNSTDNLGVKNILYSLDGQSWNYAVSGAFGTDSSAFGSGVLWNGSCWVAVGYDNTNTANILRSTDGMNWSATSSGNVGNQPLTSLAWSGSRFVTCGPTGTYYSMDDGNTWFQSAQGAAICIAPKLVQSYLGIDTFPRGQTVLNTKVLAIGKGGNVFSSTRDPTIWNDSSNLTSLVTSTNTYNNCIGWNGSIWVIGCGDIQQTETAIYYSGNGEIWNTGISTFTHSVNCIAWNGSYWLAGGTSNYARGDGKYDTINISKDGINWTSIPDPPFQNAGSTPSVLAIAWNGSLWVAIGIDTNPITNYSDTIRWSLDGIIWSSSGGETFNYNPPTYLDDGFTSNAGLAWNGKMFVACSNSQYSRQLIYSYDGIVWTSAGAPFTNGNPTSVYWTGTSWIAGGYGDYGILRSIDGINWNTTNILNANNSQTILSIVSNGKELIAGGQNIIAHSADDGLTWTAANTPIFVNNNGSTEHYVRALASQSVSIFANGSSNVQLLPGDSTIVLSQGKFNALTNNNCVTSIIKNNDIELNSIAWNGAIWVAAGNGDGFGQMMYSSDGSDWKNGSGDNFVNLASGVAWNGSFWLAVGYGANTMMKSTDGIHWSFITSPFDTLGETFWCSSIAWNGSLWVAVGADALGHSPAPGDTGYSTIFSSPDGIVWTVGTGATFLGCNIGYSAVAWNGKMWVAGGYDDPSGNNIVYSYDGKYWQTTNITGGNAFDQRVQGIAWNGIVWVAVGFDGSNNNLAISSDGINWTINSTLSSVIKGICWNGLNWVAISQSQSPDFNSVWRGSADATVWTALPNIFYSAGGSGAISARRVLPYVGLTIVPPPQTGGSSTSIGETVLVGGGYNDTLGNLLTSISLDNGVTWSSKTVTYAMYQVAWNGSLWVSANSDGSMGYSSDGINWNTTSSVFYSSANGVAWNGSYWLAVGSGANTMMKSIDGINWTVVSSPFDSGVYNARGIAWNGSLWVVTGQDTGYNTIYSSHDGVGWTVGTGSIFYLNNENSSVAWNGKIWVVVGYDGIYGNNILWSSDGKYWTSTNITDGNALTYGGARVAWNGSLWVVVGYDNSMNTLCTSTDGMTWSIINTLSSDLEGITWNGSKWFATGYDISNTMWSSIDGITWTPITNVFGTVGFSICSRRVLPYVGLSAVPTEIIPQTKVLAVSNNTVPYIFSSTGNGWTGINQEMQQLNCIGYNGTLWVVGGSGIYYSSDGLNWNNALGDSFGTRCNCIAWNGKMWIAGGYSFPTDPLQQGQLSYTTILTSLDGITWKKVPISPFQTVYNSGNSTANGGTYGITWNGNVWVATGQDALSADQKQTVCWSRDGFIWTTACGTLFERNDLGHGSVAWNGKMFVAVGNDFNSQNVLTSVDGFVWSPVTTGFSYASSYGFASSIAWNGSLWVAVGYDNGEFNNISTSSDGINWNQPTISGAGVFNSILWNGSVWIAGGETTYTSVDGINWLYSTLTNITGLACEKVPQYFYPSNPNTETTVVAFGNNNGSFPIYISPDGLNWTAGRNTGVLSNVMFGNSSDGTTQDNVVGSSSQAYGVSWNGKMWVAVGNVGSYSSYGMHNSIYNSSDGYNWSIIPNLNPDGSGGITGNNYAFDIAGLSVCSGPLGFVAVGVDNNSNNLLVSADGISWTPSGIAPNPMFMGGYGLSVICGKILPSLSGGSSTVYVAAGFDGTISGNTLYHSTTDLLDWVADTGAFQKMGVALIQCGNWFVAIGDDQYDDPEAYLWQTTDPTQGWSMGSQLFATLTGSEATASNGQIVVAVGSNAGNEGYPTIAILSFSSVDGSVTIQNPTTMFGYQGTSIIWNGSFWIATGTDTSGGTPYSLISYDPLGSIWVKSDYTPMRIVNGMKQRLSI